MSKLQITQLVEQLEELGISFRTEQGKLKVKGKTTSLTAELTTRIKQNKDALIAFIDDQCSSTPVVTGLSEGPLSFQQQRMWLFEQMEGANAVYNVPLCLRLQGRLQREYLINAVNNLIAQTSVLRSVYRTTDYGAIAQVKPFSQVSIEQQRLKSIEDHRLLEWINQPISQGECLYRFGLFELAADDHILVLNFHHSAVDGWALGLLLKQLQGDYLAQLAGLPLSESAATLGYLDYAVWQQKYYQGDKIEKDMAFWRSYLADAPEVLALPLDKPRPAKPGHSGARFEFAIPATLRRQLMDVAVAHNGSLFQVLLAGYYLLLGQLTGNDDVVIGTPVLNRDNHELMSVVGFFTNTVALRFNGQELETKQQLLELVRNSALQAMAYQHTPFEKVVDEVVTSRDPATSPLFQAMFAMQGSIDEWRGNWGDLVCNPLRAESHFAKFDLLLEVFDSSADCELVASFEYNSEILSEDSVELWSRRLLQILALLVDQNASNLADINLLLPGELQDIQQREAGASLFNADFDGLLCGWDRQVATNGEAHALETAGSYYSYRQLDRLSDALAQDLLSRGLMAGDLLGICLPRSAEIYVAVLAALKAGITLLPLDSQSPLIRRLSILESCQPKLLISTENLFESGLQIPLYEFTLDSLNISADFLRPEVADESVMYVLHTSGSTGTSKGIAISRGSFAHMIGWQYQHYNFSGDDKISQFSPLHFDVSLQEMFSGWTSGACVVMVPEEVRQDSQLLACFLMDTAVTRAFLPVVAFQYLATHIIESGCLINNLRQVFCSGEQLKVTGAIRQLAAQLPGFILSNHYGPTETHLAAICDLSGDPTQWPLFPDIGHPIGDVSCLILNTRLKRVPIGVCGELYLKGPTLANGYYNREDLTARAFIDSKEYGRIYRTGDLVSRGPNGQMRYHGRIDNQIKIRGFRIELAEIELALHGLDSVEMAAVRYFKDSAQIVAYLIGPGQEGMDTVKAELQRLLPLYAVPQHFIAVNELPTTINGKICWDQLPQPQAHQDVFVAPKAGLEQQLEAIWKQTLGLERVSRLGNFFALGGHSLLVPQVVRAIKKQLDIDIGVKTLFEAQDIATLAALIAGGKSLDQVVTADSEIARSTLSYTQERLLFLEHMSEDAAVYNIAGAMLLSGNLDESRFVLALQQVWIDNKILRSGYRQNGEQVQQWINSALLLPLETGQLASTEIKAFVSDFGQRRHDLANGEVFKAALYRLDDGRTLFALNIHHIAIDGWSLDLLYRQLQAHYNNETAALPAFDYAQFAYWQKQQTAVEGSQLAFWLEQLSPEPQTIQLPLDKTRPAKQRFTGAQLPFTLDGELLTSLESLAKRSGVTLYAVLMSAYQLMLVKLSGHDDFAVGAPVAGRNRDEWQDVVGAFVNTLVYPCQVQKGDTVSSLLERVGQFSSRAMANQDTPVEALVQALGCDRQLSHSPLFQTALSLMDNRGSQFQLSNLQCQPLAVDLGVSRFDLTLMLNQYQDRIDGIFEYSTDLFFADTLERWVGHLLELLAQMASEPGGLVADISLLRAEEQVHLTQSLNATDKPFDDQALIHQLFERRSALQPHAPAVRCRDHAWSYGELLGEVERYKLILQQADVGPGNFVGLYMTRRSEMVAATLAIMACGAAYVPMDISWPGGRLMQVIEAAELKVIVTVSDQVAALAEKLQGDNLPRVVDITAAIELPKEVCFVEPHRSSDTPAYIIFTSGTTGKPKGVLLHHKPVVNLIEWVNATWEVGAQDRILYVTSPCFDLSVYDMFGSLAAGAEVVVADDAQVKDPETLAKLIDQYQITFWDSAPASLQQVEPFIKQQNLDSLRLVFLSGDWIPLNLPDALLSKFSKLQVVALGGATEAAIWSNFHLYDGLEPHWSSIPYGKPIQNARYYILDTELKPVPVGVHGDLFIGGGCLAEGYWGNEKETKYRFIPSPFVPGERIYRTGDNVRFMADGTIEFLGRIDNQTKIRGYRIELGEIEATLSRHESVSVCTVVVNNELEHAQLVAYVVASEGYTVDESVLRQVMRKTLPEYMVPAFIIAMESLPITDNGKLDRKQLPVLSEHQRTVKAGACLQAADDVERVIQQYWRSLLNIESIPTNVAFFELGGHSIVAIKLITWLREHFKQELPITVLFEASTVQALSEVVKSGQYAIVDSAAVIAQENMVDEAAQSEFALTDLQQSYWVGQQQGMSHIEPSLYVEIDLPWLDQAQFIRAWQQLFAKHQMLRAVVNESGYWQVLQQLPEWSPQFFDYSGLTEQEIKQRREAVREQIQSKQLTTATWPLFEMAVTRDAGHDRLHLRISLLLCDGFSTKLILSELLAAYGLGSGTFEPEQFVSFAQYVQRLALQKKNPQYQRDKNFWLNRLDSLPVAPELPYNTAAALPTKLQRHQATVPQVTWRALQHLAAEKGISINSLLCAVYSAVLQNWSRNDHFLLVVMYFNRQYNEDLMAQVVGNFATTTLLEVEPLAGQDLFGFAEKLQQELWQNMTHAGFSGVEVLRALNRKRASNGEALAPVTFASGLDLTADEVASIADGQVKQVHAELQVPQVLLDHQVYQGLGGTLELVFDVADHAFLPGVVEAMLDSYRHTLMRVADNMSAAVGFERHLTSQSFSGKITAINNLVFNAPKQHIAHWQKLHMPMSGWAKKAPDTLALVQGSEQLSYAGLDTLSNALALQLIELGVKPGDSVVVSMTKNIAQVVSVFAVLKAGGVYVPVAPNMPDDRKRQIVANLKSHVVLLDGDSEPVKWSQQSLMVNLDAVKAKAVAPQVDQSNQLAYVIFTSGSTGMPKGVTIEHGAVINTLQDLIARIDLNSDDRVLFLSELSFDLSVFDLFATLSCGAVLVLPELGFAQSPEKLIELVADKRITVWNSAPQWLSLLVEAYDAGYERDVSSLRQVLLSGDWIAVDLPMRIRNIVGELAFLSLGGATEASIWSNYFDVTEDFDCTNAVSIPYGKPLSGQQMFVLDRHMDIAPVGACGDIYIGGLGLAVGYWGDTARTEQQFITHPKSGERLYRTGDLGRYLADGNIEFLGRSDFQVKVNGFRVELGDIEHHLTRHPLVAKALVATVGERNEKSLAAYIVLVAHADANWQQVLEQHLKEHLPVYMVPKAWMSLDALPVTVNGKLDRKALPSIRQSCQGNEPGVVFSDKEQKVAMLFEDVIGVSPSPADQDFFQLGGNSLTAMRLVARVKQAFGVKLNLSEILESPSVAALAKKLEISDGLNTGYKAIQLQKGEGDPLYLFHPIGGTVFCYLALVRELNWAGPVYGMQSRGVDSEATPLTSMAQMVEQFVAAIDFDDTRNYHLSGWSFGGLSAYLSAVALLEQGCKVASVTIVDSMLPRAHEYVCNKTEVDLMADFLDDMVRQDSGKLDKRALSQFDTVPAVLDHVFEQGWIPTHLQRDTLMRFFEVYVANRKAHDTMALKQSHLDLQVLFAADSRVLSDSEKAIDWQRYTSGIITSKQLDGDHYSIMRGDSLKVLAETIKSGN